VTELDITMLLIDDDPIVRAWVRLAIEGTEFRLIGEAGSVQEARELLGRRRPHVFLVDHRLPDGLGPDFVRELRQAGDTTPALMMTATPQAGLNEAARMAGANGSVLKSGAIPALLDALRIVRRGGESFDFRHPRRPSGQVPLSPREQEVLERVAAGETNQQIAEALSISSETVKTLLARLNAKLGTSRRAEAVAEAHRRNLL
jgi:DNA-binding NarL/FixJ family response regulator